MEDKNKIREVFVSYIAYVCALEGTDFLGSNGQDINPSHMGEEWTPEQIAILQECRDEARVRGGW